MDLSTTYMGFDLPHPFIAGAGPLADTVDRVRQLEDAGAAAFVLRSLFEEQLNAEGIATTRSIETPSESFAEALSYFPNPEDFVLGPEEYLDQIRKAKQAVSIPVIASLNGTTPGGWLDYAKLCEQAGADALELHVYSLATDMQTTSDAIERRTVDMVASVKKALHIPVAVKLSPFFTSLANLAARLDAVKADALVLFNRFYHPDIDVENLEVVSKLHLSDSSDLPVRLRWLAMLSGRVQASLAVTGGVHTALDAVKAIMCGAHGVQLVSALLERGPHYLQKITRDLSRWLEENEYQSLGQMRGSMSMLKCPDASPFNRASYMHVLQTWKV